MPSLTRSAAHGPAGTGLENLKNDHIHKSASKYSCNMMNHEFKIDIITNKNRPEFSHRGLSVGYGKVLVEVAFAIL